MRPLPTFVLLFAALCSPASAATLTTGEEQSCALVTDGRVACWGAERYTGGGTGGPVRTVTVADVVDVAAGRDHTCAVRQSGAVACWGDNWDGQLGFNTEGPSVVPVTAVVVTEAVAVAAGERHSCALRAAGTLRCWGDAPGGESGGGITAVVAIAAGGASTCAIQTGGTLSCWGALAVGAPPVADAVQVSVGDRHACALRAGGTVICWGANDAGQLGIGTTTPPATPADVPGLDHVAAIGAGGAHSCAVTQDGEVRCWGAGTMGQLGDGGTSDRTTPQVVAGLSGATAVAAGWEHTCALRADGAVACWGGTASGQVGNGRPDSSATPVVVPGAAGAVAVSSGFDQHRCALMGNATVRCWGANAAGQLGDGTRIDRGAPVAVGGIATATAVGAGTTHSCARLASGEVRCWGANNRGALGTGNTDSSPTPVTAVGISAKTIAVDYNYSCAVSDEATPRVHCWGERWFNADASHPGNGFYVVPAPSPIAGTEGAMAVTTMDFAACALLANLTVKCWGSNNDGELGNGTRGDGTHSTDPVTVTTATGVLTDVVAIEGVDARGTCARRADASVYCWGKDHGIHATPIAGSEFPRPANRCDAVGGVVTCLGVGRRGQLGDGFQPTGHFPVQPIAGPVVGLSAVKQPPHGPQPGDLTVGPATLAFPATVVGQTSAPLAVTIANTAAKPRLLLLSAGAPEAGSEFGVTTDCGAKLAAGASCTVAYAFHPTAAGERSGSATISLLGVGHTIALRGTGVVPGPPGGGGPGPGGGGAAFVFERAKARKRGRIALSFSFPAAGTLRIAATARVRGKRVRFFATKRPLAVKPGARALTIAPRRAARRALARTRRLKVAVKVVYAPAGGAPVTRSRTVNASGGGTR